MYPPLHQPQVNRINHTIEGTPSNRYWRQPLARRHRHRRRLRSQDATGQYNNVTVRFSRLCHSFPSAPPSPPSSPTPLVLVVILERVNDVDSTTLHPPRWSPWHSNEVTLLLPAACAASGIDEINGNCIYGIPATNMDKGNVEISGG